MTIKEKILNKIDKIQNPLLLKELDLYLDGFDDHELPSVSPLLEKSLSQAIHESEMGQGIKHEQIWEQLKHK